jgi:hypothetical protein
MLVVMADNQLSSVNRSAYRARYDAHSCPSLTPMLTPSHPGSVPVDVAVFQLYPGTPGFFGDEPDFDLAGVGRVIFDRPLGADVPAEHDRSGGS